MSSSILIYFSDGQISDKESFSLAHILNKDKFKYKQNKVKRGVIYHLPF